MNKTVLVGLACLGLLFILGSSVVFVTREVGGFNLFGSKSADCTPYNVFINKGDKDNTVEIVWLTKKECMAFIQYGSSEGNMKMIGVDQYNSVQSKEHKVVLENLLSNEKYYFLINSDNQGYGSDGVPLEFRIRDL